MRINSVMTCLHRAILSVFLSSHVIYQFNEIIIINGKDKSQVNCTPHVVLSSAQSFPPALFYFSQSSNMPTYHIFVSLAISCFISFP